MKEIPLTRSMVAFVDDQDFERISRHKWHPRKGRYTWYAVRSITVRCPKIRQTVHMHREILGLQFKDGIEGDHRDGDGLNNQRANLRVCTEEQNNRNQKARKDWLHSKYKGVSRDHRRPAGNWFARICVNRVRHRIGSFKTEEAAALAYNEAAKVHFGEFAKFNSVTE